MARSTNKDAKLRTVRAQAIRAFRRVERARVLFVRDYAPFPFVLKKGLRKFERVRAGLIAMIATVDRELAARPRDAEPTTFDEKPDSSPAPQSSTTDADG